MANQATTVKDQAPTVKVVYTDEKGNESEVAAYAFSADGQPSSTGKMNLHAGRGIWQPCVGALGAKGCSISLNIGSKGANAGKKA